MEAGKLRRSAPLPGAPTGGGRQPAEGDAGGAGGGSRGLPEQGGAVPGVRPPGSTRAAVRGLDRFDLRPVTWRL